MLLLENITKGDLVYFPVEFRGLDAGYRLCKRLATRCNMRAIVSIKCGHPLKFDEIVAYIVTQVESDSISQYCA